MSINSRISLVKSIFLNNISVIENYFFMTVLQLLNSFFYFLIYPYLIRSLGSEAYGVFIFATSIVTYFTFFINFGFDYPAVKEASENSNNKDVLKNILSKVFTAKLILAIPATIFFCLILFFIPFLRQNAIVFLLCYSQISVCLLFPQWYFQAIQKMKIVTYAQLASKVVTLPLIFIFVQTPDDLVIYAAIVALGTTIGSVLIYLIIRFYHQMNLFIFTSKELKLVFKDAFPFFFSNSAGVIKEQSITLMVGIFFSMNDVAIYDLANKIILLPRTFFNSINAAIFPKLIQNISALKVKKIIGAEVVLSLFVILTIIILGPFVIRILGGIQMIEAYPVTIFLSFTILSWIVVGAFISFVFIPQKKYILVTHNQLIALISFIIYSYVGFLIHPSVLIFAIAIALSGITEILYCFFITKSKKLMDNL